MKTTCPISLASKLVPVVVFAILATNHIFADPQRYTFDLDWSEGSEWSAYLEEYGQPVDPNRPIRPPAFGRDLSPHSRSDVPQTFAVGEQSTDLLLEIARGLDNDPLRIFNWVKTSVEYVPYNGLVQGAHTTALEMQGNDYDQAVLLASLLKIADATASVQYNIGYFFYTAPEIEAWLGWTDGPTNPNRIVSNFQKLGIGASKADDTYYLIPRVVVEYDPGDGKIVLDPAYKTSSTSPRLEVGEIWSGYDANAISENFPELGDDDTYSTGPGSVDAMQNSLRNAVANYIEQAYLRESQIDPRDILGIRKLSEPGVGSLDDPLVGIWGAGESIDELPDNLVMKFRIQLGGWDITYRVADLAGDVLWLDYDSGSTSGQATLHRNEAIEGYETGFDGSNSLSVAFGITFPTTGTPTELVRTKSISFAQRQGTSAIVWEAYRSNGRLRSNAVQQERYFDIDPASDLTRAYTMNTVGLRRAISSQNMNMLIGANLDLLGQTPFGVFFAHERGANRVVDGAYYSIRSLEKSEPKDGVLKSSGSFFAAAGDWASITESWSLEAASGNAAVSTMSVLESTLRNGKKIVRLRKDTYASDILEVEGGAAGILPGVEDEVLVDDDWAFVPSVLDNAIYGSTSGLLGSASMTLQAYGSDNGRVIGAYRINGNYNGGGTNDGADSESNTSENIKGLPGFENPDGTSPALSDDPVDLVTGSFIYQAPGLTIGNGSDPDGLSFQHFYNSGLVGQDTGRTGDGWTHSYDLSVSQLPANAPDLRSASTATLGPQIVLSQYLTDIYQPQPVARNVALRAGAVSAIARHLRESVRIVNLGNRRLRFEKSPDGQFYQSSSLPIEFVEDSAGNATMSIRHGNTITFSSLNDRAVSIADQWGNFTELIYTGTLLQKVNDRYGRSLTFAYFENQLSTVTDSAGRTVSYERGTNSLKINGPDSYSMTFETDSEGRIVRVTDAASEVVVENDYDTFGRVYQQRALGDVSKQSTLGYAPRQAFERDPLGNAEWSFFDDRSRRIRVEDRVGNVTSWSYDGRDRVVSQTTPKGGQWTWRYDPAHVLVYEENPLGQSRTIQPDAEHRPYVVNDFNGASTTFTYTAQHAVETITGPGGELSSFGYDSTGHLVSSQAPAETAATAYSNFDLYGNPQTITHPDGLTSTQVFNSLGDLVEFVDRRLAKTTYSYNNRRQPTGVYRWFNSTDPTSTTYDQQAADITTYRNTGAVESQVRGRTLLVSDGSIVSEGKITTYVTDALDQLKEVRVGPSSITVLTNEYDSRNLLWKTTDANGATTEHGYDAAWRLSWMKDARLNTTSYSYDADSNLTTTTTPLLHQSVSSFDEAGRLSTWKDALDKTVTYGRDAQGRRTSLLNRRGQTYSWTYDDVARVMTRSTPLGKTTTITRNTRGLIESIVEPSTQTTTFTSFDVEGRVTAFSDGVGDVTNSYWENGLLNSVTETIGGNPRTSQRIYDQMNRLLEYHDGEGNTLRYSYYADDRLQTITYPDGVSQVSYTYDDFGRLETVTDWVGRVTTYHYDDASRLLQIDRPNGTKRVLGYTVDNRVESVSELGVGDISLWSSNFPLIDEDGRIRQRVMTPLLSTDPLPVDAMTFDADNRVATFGALAVVHDEDGNMTSGPDLAGNVVSFTYDARDRLTGTGAVSYRYATDGQLASVTEADVATTYVIDPNAALSRTLSRTKNGVTTYYVYGLGLLYEDTGGATTTYHQDHMGSTVALSADDGVTLVDQVQYSPFGTITARIGAHDTPFLYHGGAGVMTDSSGLNYMRARFYHPRMMRFINADPIGFSGGYNWYSAFSNNPLSRFDPWGLKDSSGGNTSGIYTMSPFYVFGRKWTQADEQSYQRLISYGIIQGGHARLPTHSYAPEQGSSPDPLAFSTGLAGLTFGGIQHVQSGSTGYWIGKNGRIYPVSWGGNAYTGGRLKFAGRMSEWAKTPAKRLGYIGLGISTLEGYDAFLRNDRDAMVLASADFSAGVAGFFGPKGWAFSGSYFVGSAVDDFFGTTDAINLFYIEYMAWRDQNL